MKLGTSIKYLFLIGVAFAYLFPLYFMMSAAFQNASEINEGHIYPEQIYIYNWIPGPGGGSALGHPYWMLGVRNSLIISALSVVVGIVLSFPAAYAFSRAKFFADKHLFFWLLTNRMAPAVCFILAFLAMYRGIGLWDTIPGVVLSYLTFNLPLSIWLMVSFMNGIPPTIDESAFIDGYSLLGYFRKIFIPLNKPGIAVTGFFIWMFSWAEMFMASVLTSINAKPLTVNLLVALGRMGYGVEFGVAAAAGAFTIIPGLILIIWARSYLAAGFTFGRV